MCNERRLGRAIERVFGDWLIGQVLLCYVSVREDCYYVVCSLPYEIWIWWPWGYLAVIGELDFRVVS